MCKQQDAAKMQKHFFCDFQISTRSSEDFMRFDFNLDYYISSLCIRHLISFTMNRILGVLR